MRKVYGVMMVLGLVLDACTAKQDWMKRAIATEESNLTAQAKAGKADTNSLNSLLKKHEDYAAMYPADTNGADYLFKAAEFYRYMRRPLRSIQLYDKIYTGYPTIARHPYALFLQGFMYENEVGNPHAAKIIYEKFLTEYPTHRMAKDVRITLANLGKTPEQLIQEFQEKARQDSLAQSKQ